MNIKERSHEELLLEIENLRGRLLEAEETSRAIRNGEIDTLLVSGAQGEQVFTLKGAEKPYRILIEQMNEGAVMLDKHNSIIYCNSGFARILKKPLETIIGTNVMRYILPASLVDFEELLHFGMQEKKNDEISFIAKDGTSVPLYLSLKSLNIDGTETINLIAMDLTERKQAENELRRAHDELELRVNERTEELIKTNEVLKVEIIEHQEDEEALRKAHDELELHVQNRTSQLKDSLDEKEILLREIHHRVKNNMQVISGLLMLQEEFSNDAKISDLIKESQNRIASMALIHEKLYRSENLSKIDFKDYVEDLVSGLFESYGITESKVGLRINAENISMGIDIAIPCGLIINELISNSLKHAFPSGEKGEIEISLRSTDDNMIELLARDNGVGIPEGIDFRKTESLGLHIVNILVENQLHGEITMNKNKGTEFRIRFRRMK